MTAVTSHHRAHPQLLTKLAKTTNELRYIERSFAQNHRNPGIPIPGLWFPLCFDRRISLGCVNGCRWNGMYAIEVANAKRNVGRPLLRFKDCAKRDMAAFNIDHQNWQRLAEGRADWRRSVMEGCIKCDKAWFATLADKREKKLQSDTEPTAQRFSCQTCGRPCRS
ncbi:hypothetical protein ACJJTC_013376 [Scirpophaga incertulas]